MKKRILSIVLVLAMILLLCGIGGITASADDNAAIIRVGGNSYAASVGDFIEYRVAFRYTGGNLSTAQIEVPMDFSGLSGYTQSELASFQSRIAPSTGSSSVIERFDGDGTTGMYGYVMNFVSSSGYSFSTQKIVLSLMIGIEKPGVYDLSAKIKSVEDAADNVIVDNDYQVLDNRFTFSEDIVQANLETPRLNVQTYAGGMKIDWNPVPRAALYRVYYKGPNGWTRIKDTADTTYLDTNVVSGMRYTYTVRCINADATRFTSDFDRAGKSAIYYTAPILKLSNAEDAVSIKWDPVPQAAKYRVYYKSGTTWKAVAADTTATSLLDKDVRSGSRYTYTIRALDASGRHLSWFYPEGFSITFLSAPVFNLSNEANGVKISWNTVPGAEKYRVFYNGSRGWTKLVDTASTSFIDTDVSSNRTYKYTVRCLNQNATAFTSDYRAGKYITYYAAPKLQLSNAENGVYMKWDPVEGAAKYRLYYKGRNGWTKLTADTTSTSFLDKYVSSGATYTYTIRALDANGNHLSWFYTDGFRIQYVAPPVITVSNIEDGVKISWEKPAGSQKYRVYYMSSKGWTRLADTTDNYYIDKNVKSNTTCTYTVRCINEEATAFTSYFHAGKSVKYYAAPKPTLTSTAQGVNITWDAVEGAYQYRLYYWNGSTWAKVTDTRSTSYLDTEVLGGYTYTYTMRAMDANGRHISWFYPEGFTITFIRQSK